MFDQLVAEVAALNPTFVQPVASSIPSGNVTGGHPSRSRFKDSLYIVRKYFLYLAFGAMFFYNVTDKCHMPRFVYLFFITVGSW